MQEWSFKDEATAEAFLKARKRQLRHKADSAKKRLLQVWHVCGAACFAGLSLSCCAMHERLNRVLLHMCCRTPMRAWRA